MTCKWHTKTRLGDCGESALKSGLCPGHEQAWSMAQRFIRICLPESLERVKQKLAVAE